ncbi:gibberellin 20 oxidase 2-like [Arachis stenosperma]|uniref:gibberellin 20 oxidase 2-like n=1 Tax=Arachis stenosperma TaxID=217475 RepID=UPI0025ACC514|nr:gibberellin 20 oxidase 2-like [Arachis stenosperma]
MDSSLLLSTLNQETVIGVEPPHLPTNFVWPMEDLVDAHGELEVPVVNLSGFLSGNDEATWCAARLVHRACLSHGFFQVINHGVDPALIAQAYAQMDNFFRVPTQRKLSFSKKPGLLWGYSGAHVDRFSSKLPWKETLSFPYYDHTFEPVVANYFNTTLGEDFQQTGVTFQKYCKAMKELGVKLTELLAISLGLKDRLHYKELFEEGCSIMRCNYYPPCHQPSLTLGTGPHCDPTSITILHQDQVGGLQVFADKRWKNVQPRSDAFIVNIGDTFTALSNGRYKSCLHRAVVNRYKERRSLAFFLCPKEDKILRPPQDILRIDGTKHFPDFTWSDLLLFTQKHYRADEATLHNFTNWFLSSKTDK